MYWNRFHPQNEADRRSGRLYASLAEITGFTALTFFLLLISFDALLATIPLALFLCLCLIAPFMPRFSFFVPIISRGRSGLKAVALTFDDGPDPQTTPLLLELLKQFNAPATFFVTGRKARRHADLIRQILVQGHTIGNHTFHHDNFLMLKSSKNLMHEIKAAQEALAAFGIRPLAFRPPVGITNPRLSRVLSQLNLFTVNFSRRPRDLGNRRVRHLSVRILSSVKPDDIILLHDVTPPKAALLDDWLEEIERLLTGLKNQGLDIAPLSGLIERNVMLNLNDQGSHKK